MVGAPSWLPPQGYFGLMFLKHYLKLSDEKLLERSNTNWAMRLFGGTLLGDNGMITAIDLSPKDAQIFKTIKVIYQQHKHHFDSPKAKTPYRIVSIHKPYIKPIVRGKENKPVEFGIKVHKM